MIEPLDRIFDVITGACMTAGVAFFLAGSLGLLRFPDVFTRLHAVTKADNLGLGLVVAGLVLQSEDFLAAIELGVIWILILVAGTTAAQLVSRTALADGQEPWKR